MAFKKINKKGEATVQYVIISILMLIGLFTGLFLFVDDRLQYGTTTMDDKYRDTYSKLNESRNDLETLKSDLKDKANAVAEADQGWQVAWNGLLGLGTALKAPFVVVTTGEKTVEAIDSNLTVIPPWAKGLITLGIIITIILIILAAWKGDQKLI